MSTAYPFAAETLADVIKQHKKSVIVDRTCLESLNDRAAKFTSLLQTSLDITTVLNIFAEQTAKIASYSGITYSNKRSLTDVVIGVPARHSCNYQLTLEDENLGEICISRKQRFTDSEMESFEALISLLLYPLRNCMHFQQAQLAASKDPMTGLNNRRSMDEHIAHESKIAMRYGNPLAMLVLDIDHFKRINDTYGHKAGDCLIKALADILKNTARATDYIFRYGGEEFVMLLPNTTPEGAHMVAERIRETIEECECLCHGEIIKMTASIGISTLTSRDKDDSLFLRADSALYKAKQSGRNQVRHS